MELGLVEGVFWGLECGFEVGLDLGLWVCGGLGESSGLAVCCFVVILQNEAFFFWCSSS